MTDSDQPVPAPVATKRKRGHGEGSIYFDNARGSFAGAISLGKDQTGKRIRKVVYGATKSEVRKLLEAARDEVKSGVDAKSRETVRGLFDQWFSDSVSLKEAATQTAYRRVLDVHVYPAVTPSGACFGDLALKRVTLSDVRSVFKAMVDGGYARTSRKAALLVLSRGFRRAVKDRLVGSSPVDKEDLRDFIAGADTETMDPFTAEEARRFLESVRDDRLYALYYLALETGARMGELLGLQWSDVDFATGAIHFKQALKEHRSKATRGADQPRQYLGSLKNKKARTVSVSPTTLSILKAHAAVDDGAVVNLGARTGFVFQTRSGTPYFQANIQKQFVDRCSAAGVRTIRFHDLRHTNATLLIAQGVNVKTVAKRLGHSDVALTLRKYVHDTPEQNQHAAGVMGGLLGAGR